MRGAYEILRDMYQELADDIAGDEMLTLLPPARQVEMQAMRERALSKVGEFEAKMRGSKE